MRFVRKNEDLEILDVFADDRVSVAAAKIARSLGEPVYLWTVRDVTPYEGLGMVVEDIAWSSAEETIRGEAVEKSLQKLLGVRTKPPKAVDRMWVVEALRDKKLSENVACAFRYIVVGGYFADHGVDPEKSIPRGFNPQKHGLVDTSQMLLESFGTDVFNVVTRSDIEAMRPAKVDPRSWQSVVARYRFEEGRDRDLDRETMRYNDLLGHPKNLEIDETTLTYAKVAGACLFRAAGVDPLMTTFADLETSPDTPMVRLGNHALGTVLTRLHESLVGSPELERYIVSRRKNFLQVLLKIPDSQGYALLEVFPEKYYLSARFSSRDRTDTAAFASVFPAANDFLRTVSPYYVPLTESVFENDYINNSVKLSDYRASLVDMWFSVDIISRKKMCDMRSFYNSAADGGPILKPVNVSRDERKAFLQFVRSSNVSKEALVRNFLVHNSGASGTALARKIVADYKLSAEDAAEMVREFQEIRRFEITGITTVRVDKQSASRAVIRIELVRDERHVRRIAGAVVVLMDECTRGAAGKRVVASVDVIKTISDKVQSKIGDIDEFMDLVNISEPGLSQNADELESGDSGMGSDVLRALQQRDPAIFGFKATGVFRPYSVQCQDRQPVILNDEEFQRVLKESTDGSFKGSITYGSDRKFNYICPRKWCVTSKVARKQGESCPIRDEPENVFGETTFPGYITGSKHPAGLCMPCCFKKEPVPGSKVYERKALCEGNAPAEREKNVEEKGHMHLSRSDRILDVGYFGKVPESLADHVPNGLVRRGMGSNTSFFDAVEYVFDDPKFLASFSKEIAYHHYLTGDPRSAGGNSEDGATKFERWWKSPDSATYKTVFSLKSLTPLQRKREQAAHARFLGAVVAREDSHDKWLRPINSFTPSSRPHIVVLTDSGEKASVEADEIRSDREAVAFILHRGGRYEPLGYINDREFQAVIPWSQPWARKLVDAQLPPQVPPDTRRVLSTNFMVTAVLFASGGVLALPTPVAFNPKYPHVHLSDLPRNTPVADKEAKKMRHPFYRGEYLSATRTLLDDSDVDLRLFIDESVQDKRSDVLRNVNAKAEAEAKYAKAIWDIIGDDPLIKDPRQETSARITALRRKYARKLPAIPPYITEYIIERLMRPVGVTVVPVIKKRDDEIVYSETK